MEPNSQGYRSAKKAEILERRLKVAQLYLVDRKTQSAIAAILDVGIATVNEDLAALKAQWRQQAHLAVEEHIAVELRKIQQLEDEAKAAYEKSCQPKRIASASRTTGLEGSSLTTSATQMERLEGDPRFLAIIAKCTEQRIKLLGLRGQPDDDEEEQKQITTLEDLVLHHNPPPRPATDRHLPPTK